MAPSQRSPSAQQKVFNEQTTERLLVHSFRSLLTDLATLMRNRVRLAQLGEQVFDLLATPTPLQERTSFSRSGLSCTQ